MDKVLLTGGAGFIGSHILDMLLEQGVSVRVLDNLSTGKLSNLAQQQGSFELIQDDIRDFAACRSACKTCELVIHQAALGSVQLSLDEPSVTHAVNDTGTLNIFEAARQAGIERVVYASSTAVYGDSQLLPLHEGLLPRPQSPYAASKLCNEAYARSYLDCFGLQCIGLRYFNVYGPRQDPSSPYAAAIPLFFRTQLAGEQATIFGDGEQTRDFVYVEDVARANLAAALAPSSEAGKVFNIATAASTTVLELVRAIAACVGKSASFAHAPPRTGEIRHSAASIDLAKQCLGWSPQVDLHTGLERTASAYMQVDMDAACR